MSKYNGNASKDSGLPPNTTTRLQLPTFRLQGKPMPQSNRKDATYGKSSGRAFGKVGIVGPQK